MLNVRTHVEDFLLETLWKLDEFLLFISELSRQVHDAEFRRTWF